MEAKGGLEIDGKLYPIPPGDTPYCFAKRAEYIEKDLVKAEHYYLRAIESGERLASSVKDLASILHQTNRTAEACKLLRAHAYLYKKSEKQFVNLLGNLERQIAPTGNCLNKCLQLTNMWRKFSTEEIQAMFGDCKRIVAVRPEEGQEVAGGWSVSYTAVVEFSSHSAARKALQSFKGWDEISLFWMTAAGEVTGPVKSKSPNYAFKLFSKDPTNAVFALPIDGYSYDSSEEVDQDSTDGSSSTESLSSNSYQSLELPDDLWDLPN